MKDLSLKLYLGIIAVISSLFLYSKNRVVAEEDGLTLVEWLAILAIVMIALFWIFFQPPINLYNRILDLGDTSSDQIQNINNQKTIAP